MQPKPIDLDNATAYLILLNARKILSLDPESEMRLEMAADSLDFGFGVCVPVYVRHPEMVPDGDRLRAEEGWSDWDGVGDFWKVGDRVAALMISEYGAEEMPANIYSHDQLFANVPNRVYDDLVGKILPHVQREYSDVDESAVAA